MKLKNRRLKKSQVSAEAGLALNLLTGDNELLNEALKGMVKNKNLSTDEMKKFFNKVVEGEKTKYKWIKCNDGWVKAKLDNAKSITVENDKEVTKQQMSLALVRYKHASGLEDLNDDREIWRRFIIDKMYGVIAKSLDILMERILTTGDDEIPVTQLLRLADVLTMRIYFLEQVPGLREKSKIDSLSTLLKQQGLKGKRIFLREAEIDFNQEEERHIDNLLNIDSPNDDVIDVGAKEP